MGSGANMRIIIPAILTIVTTGCVMGAGVVTKGTSTVAVPSFLTSDTQLREFCPSTAIGVLSACDKNELPSKDEFVRAWGHPKSHETKEGKEYLSYNRNLAWRGLIVIPFIPIPLLLPTGHNKTLLVFENEKLVEVDGDYNNGQLTACIFDFWSHEVLGCDTKPL